MLFSSPTFLFGLLPAIVFVYYLCPRSLKNASLLVASLLFYAWGEMFYTGVMVASITMNYLAGLAIDQFATRRKLALGIGVAANLSLLGIFKYSNFAVANINELLQRVDVQPIVLKAVHLPLGVSFFTFQAISYLIDVYRRDAQSQRSFVNLALYISLFPQLIAGPIVRYQHIVSQMRTRRHSAALFANGIERFVFGLAKKLLIANTLGEVADLMFSLPSEDLPVSLAWLGAVCYALQIYFDFSGYSDMAIGLGKMFGFEFLENFNYPYISRSIQEFWRRWHISLSTWFRDYLYIPLGGSRVAGWRVYFNLVVVFLLCGLWHGAAWQFVAWGCLHGCFLVLERMSISRFLPRIATRPLAHAYVLGVVLVGWIFFRADSLSAALTYLSAMIGLGDTQQSLHVVQMYATNEVIVALLVGLVLSTPVFPAISRALGVPKYIIVRLPLLVALLLFSVLKISAGTYDPFIYFRF